MNRAMALVAFAVLTAFLGTLVLFVPRVDLIAVIAVTLALAGFDLWNSARR